MVDRIKQLQEKIRRMKTENKEDKKNLERVKRWAKKNPLKDMRVPFVGLQTPTQTQATIKQHQERIKSQTHEIKERQKRLRELKRG